MKSETGFAKVAGFELTLLDCAGYFHKSAGINGLAQIVKDLGTKADAGKLARAAEVYGNAAVRGLGYLLEHAGYAPQAHALATFANRAKTSLLLDPSVKPFLASLAAATPRAAKWELILNEPVEVDF
ncbi:MAG: type IV toxin-antitoxin system AbiEi family antitoxin [Terracidiphilus sp.]